MDYVLARFLHASTVDGLLALVRFDRLDLSQDKIIPRAVASDGPAQAQRIDTLKTILRLSPRFDIFIEYLARHEIEIEPDLIAGSAMTRVSFTDPQR